MTDPFLLRLPTTTPIPVLANLPHSGLLIPAAIAERLAAGPSVLPNQDWHLDQLYDFLPDLGITVLQAVYSRYVVDLNRSLQAPLFGSFWHAAIAEKTAFEQPLYQLPPSDQEIQARVEQYYHPYHQQLQTLLNQLIQQFGKVYLLDLHSFLGLIEDDICLGNAHGKTCSDRLISLVEAAFRAKGYGVVCNKVFTGGYITQHYGKMPQVEALQIEVRYPVYLNAEQLESASVPDWQGEAFDRAKRNFEAIFGELATALRDR